MTTLEKLELETTDAAYIGDILAGVTLAEQASASGGVDPTAAAEAARDMMEIHAALEASNPGVPTHFRIRCLLTAGTLSGYAGDEVGRMNAAQTLRDYIGGKDDAYLALLPEQLKSYDGILTQIPSPHQRRGLLQAVSLHRRTRHF